MGKCLSFKVQISIEQIGLFWVLSHQIVALVLSHVKDQELLLPEGDDWQVME